MRDIKKAVNEYNNKFLESNKGQFYISDFEQIKEMSNNNLYNIMTNSLCAGFIIGYRFAKNESRKGQ